MSVLDHPSANVRVVESCQEFQHLFGLFGVKPGECFLQALLRVFDFDGGLGVEHLPAAVAERGFAVVLPATGRAVDGRDWVGLVGGDVLAVEASELPLAVLAEDADVPSRGVGAPDPAVMVFDVGLVEVATGEERGAGLPEVGQRDRTRDAGILRSILEDVVDHPVGDGFGAVQLRPQRLVAVASVGMIPEPATDPRHTGDEEDGSLALLAVNGQLEAVFVVLDVTDADGLEFAPAEAGVELQGDHRGVSGEGAGLDHRLDIGLPAEHVARVGRRVVIAARAGRDPVDTVGHEVAISDALREDAERAAVVPVGLLVGVGRVDPRDDALGGITIFEGSRELAVGTVLGDEDTVSQELLVSVVAVLLGEQVEPVAEGVQHVGVGVGDVLTIINARAKRFNSIPRSIRHTNTMSMTPFITQALNRYFTAGPWLRILGSKPQTASSSEYKHSGPAETVNSRFKANGGVAA